MLVSALYKAKMIPNIVNVDVDWWQNWRALDNVDVRSKMFPVRAIMYSIKGLYYPKKVLAGMRHASHALPGNFLGQPLKQEFMVLVI